MSRQKLNPSESELRESAKSSWSKLFKKIEVKDPDIIPEGFYSIEQIAKESKKSITRTTEKLLAALKLGLVEMKRFKPEGEVRPIKHYRIL